MEYIIIGILILLVVLVTISLFKNINEGNITERLGKLENNVTRDLYDFKNDINKNVANNLFIRKLYNIYLLFQKICLFLLTIVKKIGIMRL